MNQDGACATQSARRIRLYQAADNTTMGAALEGLDMITRFAISACLGMALVQAAPAKPVQAASAQPAPRDVIPITHVIMIMQENRSFDSYFGTFPGANGFPAATCVPVDPTNPAEGCVIPFHDRHDSNSGGPHGWAAAAADLDDGITTATMDGYVHQQIIGAAQCDPEDNPQDPRVKCLSGMRDGVGRHDVMGYHTDQEIPNYWAYAQNFVLQDNLFMGARGWSLPAHLELVSEWSASCGRNASLAACTSTMTPMPPQKPQKAAHYPWVSLFQLLDTYGVTWKYYLANGTEPDCEDDEMNCKPQRQHGSVLTFWNPAPGFAWVQQQGPDYIATHNPDIDQFLLDVKNGTLPQVSWIVPTSNVSEHPPASITAGMEYVTSLVNAVMQSQYWQNTAIFVSWDDWGGFYDHVVPPVIDFDASGTQVQGYGLRVPGLLISAYAKPGMIDHAVLSFDNYAMLFEKLFMGGVHLDPTAMGQPDSRPTIRDAVTTVTYPDGSTGAVGDLLDEFDFTQPPNPPLILSTHIPTVVTASCNSTNPRAPEQCQDSSVTIAWLPVAAGQVPGPFTYYVMRDDAASAVCSTATTSCVDAAPGSGVHFYSVYSVDSNNLASPPSAAAEADVP